MSLKAFQQSQDGQVLAPILTRPDMVLAMEKASMAARPAAEAVGSAIASAVGSLTDTQKKLVGRWIREVLGARGWRPLRKADVKPGNFFRRGTVYRLDAVAGPPSEAPAWLAEAHKAVGALVRPGSVSEMLADRRRDALREAKD